MTCGAARCPEFDVREFSAIGYFFARDLQKELKMPIGILTLTGNASLANYESALRSITYTNNSPDYLDKLPIRLYMNSNPGFVR